MDSYQNKFKEQAKAIIRRAIAERPLSMDELRDHVRNAHVPYATRATHEAAWQMAEDGEAFWNNEWRLELTKA